MLSNLHVGVFSSSEVVNSVEIPGFSDPRSGITYFPKQRLVTLTQNETLSCATAAGIVALPANTYRFGARLLGQVVPVEVFMAPNLVGGICFESPTITTDFARPITPTASAVTICDASSKTTMSKMILPGGKN